jgi:transmembrane sensor
MSRIEDARDAYDIAADLFLRRRSPAWRAEDERELEAWLAASPAHRQRFDEVARTWEAAGRAAASEGVRRLRAEALAARPQGQPRWRRSWARAAAVVAVLVLVGGVGTVILRATSTGEASSAQTYRTAVGERATIGLADGSRLLLNTASEVAVDYSAGRRNLRLVAGEAWFDVAKDPKRPFVVQAGRHAVTAVGTSFDVRLEPDGLRVAVVEGRVAVDAAGRGRLSEVGAGERMDIAGETAVVRPSGPVGGDWREGRIEFASVSLGEAVAEMNRYRRTPIVVTDPAVARLRVSGVFYSGDSSGFLDALPLTHPVSVEVSGDAVRIGPARDKKTSSAG